VIWKYPKKFEAIRTPLPFVLPGDSITPTFQPDLSLIWRKDVRKAEKSSGIQELEGKR